MHALSEEFDATELRRARASLETIDLRSRVRTRLITKCVYYEWASGSFAYPCPYNNSWYARAYPRVKNDEKHSQKIALLPIPPNLAHGKLIDLANYVPSSSPHRILSSTQRFNKTEKNGSRSWEVLVAAFAMNESLYRKKIFFKRTEFRPAELFAFKILLILMSYISEFMLACF